MNIIIAVIIFGLVVFVHELGHYLLAKKNGIRVTEFSLGMGPRIASFVKGDTRYSLKLLPLGGSCMMLGEDGTDDTQTDSFISKSVFSRFSTILAGPVFNFVLALILSVIYVNMNGYDLPVVSDVTEKGAAYEAGLQDGDVIINYNGKKISSYGDLAFLDYFNPMHTMQEIRMDIRRNDKIIQTTLRPEEYMKYLLGFDFNQNDSPVKVTAILPGSPIEQKGLQAGDFIISINRNEIESGDDLRDYLAENPLNGEEIELSYLHDNKKKNILVKPKPYEYHNYGFSYGYKNYSAKGISALKYGYQEFIYWIKTGFKSIGYLVVGKVGLNQMTGPVGLINGISESVDQTQSLGIKALLSTFLTWSILLSSNLGLMNLLPIPALDGGRLLFLLIEAVRGKPISREKEAYIHAGGFVLLMCLMVFVFFNDIKALF